MTCLLCHRHQGSLRRVGADLWALACIECGRYQFDGPFASTVQSALARGDRAVLRYCVRLSSTVRDHDDVLTIRQGNYATLVDDCEC